MKHPIQTLMRYILSAALVFIFVGTNQAFSQDDITVGFIGSAESAAEIDPEGAAALEYAEANYSVNYIAVADIQANGVSAFDGNDVIWWHFPGFEGGTDLPPASTSGPALAAFNSYVEGGGGLYLSGMASQLATAMGVNGDPPNFIVNNEGIESGEWGFAQLETEHPIFEGLANPFYTVSPGLVFQEAVAWIDDQFFDGTRLATIEADPNFVATTTGEWTHGDGSIIFVSTGAYVFNYEGTNTNEDNLYLYTSNILEYLAEGSIGTSSEGEQMMPKAISLHQNYPNPFNPTTNISFSLDQSATVSLSVYDMLGREVASPVMETRYSAGQHQVVFDASGLSSGLYIYQMKAGNQVFTKKMNLIK